MLQLVCFCFPGHNTSICETIKAQQKNTWIFLLLFVGGINHRFKTIYPRVFWTVCLDKTWENPQEWHINCWGQNNQFSKIQAQNDFQWSALFSPLFNYVIKWLVCFIPCNNNNHYTASSLAHCHAFLCSNMMLSLY